jgi:hypothetical protein
MCKPIKSGLFVAIIFAAPAAMAAPKEAPAPAVQAVVNCRAETDDSRRLACYDKTVAAMAQAEGSGELVTLDRAQRQAVRRQAFGLTMPSFSIFDRGEQPKDLDNLAVTIAEAHKDREDKWVVRLDDGAVWRQIDDTDLYHGPHAGSKAVITRGLLGSFFMKIDGSDAMRVRREA